MSEAKHTPGPWQVDTTVALGAYGVWKNAEEGMLHICSVKTGETERPREERDANARLIAAAPDLLAACKLAVECGQPERISLYDEEGIEGWIWKHPDGREWTETGDWNEIPPHPEIPKAISKAEGTAP